MSAVACRSCRSPLAADQRYCLECGTRNGPTRLDWRAMVVPAEAAAVDDFADGPGLPTPRTAAALVLGVLALGVVLGHAAGPGATTADAGGRPNVTILAQAPAALPAAPAPAAPPIAAPEPSAPATQPDTVIPDTTPAQTGTDTSGSTGTTGSSGTGTGTSTGSGTGSGTPGSGNGTTDTPATPAPKRPPVKHVWVVALTGHSYDETFGPASPAPYLANELRAKGTLLPWYHAVGHDPSAGGVALLGGQKDATGPFPAATKTLADQLTDAGRSWKAYVEGSADGFNPGDNPCSRPADQQPRNPFLRFASITGSSECGSSLAAPEQLAADIVDSASAPSFSYVLPGPAHDGSTSLADADAWLRTVVQPILDSKAYADGGLVVITFDAGAPDDAIGGGGRTGALVLSPFAAAGGTVGAPYDAFALLRSIEDLFALDPLGYAKDTKLKPFGRKVYAAWDPTAAAGS